jgi:hypothetical protein
MDGFGCGFGLCGINSGGVGSRGFGNGFGNGLLAPGKSDGGEWKPGKAVGGMFPSAPLQGRYGTSSNYRRRAIQDIDRKVRGLHGCPARHTQLLFRPL